MSKKDAPRGYKYSKFRDNHRKGVWSVTIKLFNIINANTGRPAVLDVTDFTYRTIACEMGAAINRAVMMLKNEPSLYRMSYRQAMVSVKWLEYADPDPSLMTTSGEEAIEENIGEAVEEKGAEDEADQEGL